MVAVSSCSALPACSSWNHAPTCLSAPSRMLGGERKMCTKIFFHVLQLGRRGHAFQFPYGLVPQQRTNLGEEQERIFDPDWSFMETFCCVYGWSINLINVEQNDDELNWGDWLVADWWLDLLGKTTMPQVFFSPGCVSCEHTTKLLRCWGRVVLAE